MATKEKNKLGGLIKQPSVFVCFYSKVGKHPTEVDNIHNILATAAVRFNSNQLDHLFVLIQQVTVNVN